MSPTDTRREWELRIADFRASGLTQTKWCEVNNFKIHQFKYWLRKIEKTPEQPKPSSKWIPITMENQFDESNESLKIKIGQASLEVKPGFDPVFLADVVRTLGVVMLNETVIERVYLARESTDLRKSIDGLAALV